MTNNEQLTYAAFRAAASWVFKYAVPVGYLPDKATEFIDAEWPQALKEARILGSGPAISTLKRVYVGSFVKRVDQILQTAPADYVLELARNANKRYVLGAKDTESDEFVAAVILALVTKVDRQNDALQAVAGALDQLNKG